MPSTVTLLVTLDTGVLEDRDRTKMNALIAALPADADVVTASVSGRERGLRDIVPEILESAVWDESFWDTAVWASEDDVDVFERALRIIGSGSFPPPGKRGDLTHGERNQLRDAMVFDTHVRERRHLLITTDRKGFTKDPNREQLEALGSATIRTPEEVHEIASRPDAADVFAAPLGSGGRDEYAAIMRRRSAGVQSSSGQT